MMPLEMQLLDQWVCAWKNSKVPMQATIRKAASCSDPSTWSSFDTALNAVQRGVYDYLGFVFADNGIVGIDIDVGYENGEMTPVAKDIIDRCSSYTEKSRSGRGMHVYVKGSIPFTGRNNGSGIEIYKSKRYFIVTAEPIGLKDLRENQEALDYVVERFFPVTEEFDVSKVQGKRIYSPQYTSPTDTNGKVQLKPKYPPIPAGNRNNSLTSLAGQLKSQGYPRREIYKALQEANRTACQPPLPDSEIQAITTSVCKYKR